jgi:uncharacterized membrane protein YcaP (DUF421 family)
MAIDWNRLLVPSVSLVELVIRGSIMYLVIFTVLRLFRRESGTLSTADLIVVVLVADAAQNGMASDYQSVTEGGLLVATIFAWNFGLDWLAFRYKWAHRLLTPPPLLLVRDGRVQGRNLRAEMLTMDDLMEQLREHGIEDVTQVKRSYLESDGRLSVIKREGFPAEQSEKKAV